MCQLAPQQIFKLLSHGTTLSNIITRKESKHWCHTKQVLIRQFTDTSTTLTGLQNRNTKHLHLYCTGGCDICLGDWGCTSGGVYVPFFFCYKICTCMPGESYSRWLSSLLLCLCDLWGGCNIWLIEAVLLVESMYLVFISMPGKSYHSQLRSLLLCLCDIWVLMNSLVCWFWFGRLILKLESLVALPKTG